MEADSKSRSPPGFSSSHAPIPTTGTPDGSTSTFDARGYLQKIISENGIPVDLTAFIYDDFKVIATLDSSGNPKQTFHWTLEGPGALLALTDHRTSPRQTHVAGYDGRGNLTTLLNAADASLSAAYEYAPFGEVIRATGPYAPQNPVGFSTTWTDRTTHLNYYGYRFYHPAEGRFLNQDPIEEQGGNNLYAAFSGDPVNRWDFRGLSDGDSDEKSEKENLPELENFHVFGTLFDLLKYYGGSYGGSSGDENVARWIRQTLARELSELEESYSTAGSTRTTQQTETQVEEWKPTKENCDALRSFNTEQFKTHKGNFMFASDALIAATIRSGAATRADQGNPDAWEWGSAIYVNDKGFGFTEPKSIPRPSSGLKWVPHVPDNSTIIGVTHSHDITLEAWKGEYKTGNFDPARLEYFSAGDMLITTIPTSQGRLPWVGLHTPSCNLKIFGQGRFQIHGKAFSNPTIVHQGGRIKGSPTPEIVNKIIQCINEGN